MSHTPGPWRIVGCSLDDANKPLRWYVSGEGYTWVTDLAGETTDADLRLIAAAPELLEALSLVLPLAEAWADGKGRSHPDHEVVADARAAIAKAEGT
jgi:hypothetical protein